MFELNKEEILRILPGAKSNVEEDEIFAGRDKGRFLSFDNQTKDISLRVISALWLKGNRVYVISCTGEIDKFEKYRPVFRRVISSLRIK